MASADPRDPMYGAPYTGSPVQQAARSGKQTVLDMNYQKSVTVTVSASDSHYLPNGDMYHE